MDTLDVSNTEQYIQCLRGQQQRLRDAQAREGQRPTRPPRAQVLAQFQLKMMRSQFKAAAAGPQTSFMRTSFVPLPYPPCVLPFSSLEKVMIDDLLLETHHRGSYLLVRTVTPQDRMTAVMAIVEDENGDVLCAQLYHQEDDADIWSEHILPPGTVLILKEPYLKLMSDGNYGLRVDHLSDIMFLATADPRIPDDWQRELTEHIHAGSALAWKTIGNNHFNKSEFRSAIKCYTRALACLPTAEETRTISLNRSLAFVKTQQLDASLADVESVMVTATGSGKPAEKALFRKAEALHGLGKHRECCEVLKELRLAYPNNAAAKDKLASAIRRLAEQTSGKFLFKELHAEVGSLRPPHLDHATYIGPVSIRASGSRGRGLFTTRAVKAGELLFCEKAFTHAFVDKEGGRGCDITMLIDTENGGTVGSQSDLITMTIQKLHRNPSLMPIITDLHHGSYRPVEVTEVDGKPVVDTFLIRRIIALNVFGCPLSTRTSLQQRIRNVQLHKAQEDPDSGFHSCGLWPTASYINHSCTSNARRSFIGDMMIARATRDLEPDTEITWWYQIPNAENYAQRSKIFQQQWGFNCDCALCADERDTSAVVRGKRAGLVKGLERYLGSLTGGRYKEEAVVGRLETVMGALAATYTRPETDVPRLAVWEAVQKALVKLMRDGKRVEPVRMVKLLLGALASLGFVIEGGLGDKIRVQQWGPLMHGVLECWILLRDMYRMTAPELVAPAEGYAMAAYRMLFGEDETFEDLQ